MPDRPDPVTDRLARFTPNPAGLDRDALLFAAGRRSARGSWLWKTLAGVFATTQIVTLLALWPRPQPAGTFVGPPVVAPAAESEPPPPPASSPVDMWTAGSRPDVLEEGPALSTVQFVESQPPLTVRSGFRFD